MSERVYAPVTVKEVAGQYGSFLKISANADKLAAWITANRNDKGYINLTVTKRKETGKYGETHSAYLDTFIPRQDSGNRPPGRDSAPSNRAVNEPADAPPSETDDVPF